ncbi:MAG TPA: MFS transporter [Planctomycetota bacterium]|nr:MFS transporter [Planctomycetota bacterium]
MAEDAQTPSESDEQVTYRYERWRAVAAGILETAGSTFLLYIAVKFYQAGPSAKALVAAGGNFGMILTPLTVYWVAMRGWRVSKVAAAMLAAASVAFAMVALLHDETVFILGSMLGMTLATSIIPLLTQMYQDNYPADRRGRLFSGAFMIRIAAATLFSYLAGELLETDILYFPLLLGVFAAELFGSAVLLSRCPSRPLHRDGQISPFRGLRHVRDDALFRMTLLSWMLMGFANLMMVQLRVEYMANPRYGTPFQADQIALLTGVIPNIARLALSPLWGRLFDRMNFFGLRFILNVGFAMGAIAFFAGRDMEGMIFGAIIFGISNAGGDVAWSLWVTKLAPPDRVAEYMSVHTFLTGLRGVLAPLVAFHAVTKYSFQSVSISAAVLMVLASLLLVPEIRSARSRKENAALAEEVAD